MGEENDGQKAGEQQQSEFKAITSQADLDRIIGERVSRERGKFADYEDLKKKADAFDEAENKNKSELQKERERADAAERKASELEADRLRAQVALAKGLTASQAKRLVGATKEELEADADELLADLGGSKGGSKPDPKRLQSGSKGNGDDSGLTGKERAAELLRNYRASSH